MPTAPTFAARAARVADRPARRTPLVALALLTSVIVLISGCVGTGTDRVTAARPDPTNAVPIPPKAALPLDQAAAALADATLMRADLPPPGPDGRYLLVVDPLIERATGTETAATRAIGRRIEALVGERHPRFELRPFTTASLEARPLILLGSMSAVAEAGSRDSPSDPGKPPAYRIWAVLADLSTGRIVSHQEAWVRTGDVNTAPTPFYSDSPAWTTDGAAAAYLQTCTLDPGDPIDPGYLRIVRAQALVADGVRAYEAGRYREALAQYEQAKKAAPNDQQMRIRNGLYLTYRSLGRSKDAEEAFGSAVDYGLERGRLAVKFVFVVNSTEFWPDPAISGPYPMWLRQIAARAAEHAACFDVEGHASPTGPVDLNDRLSLARAKRVRQRLLAQRPALGERLDAEGRGFREPIIGTGADDASDVLDRRVQFVPQPCAEIGPRPGSPSASTDRSNPA